MRSLLSAAVVAVSATVLTAQTTTNPSGSGSQQTVTMNGCITAGSTASAPFMLSNAVPLAPTTVPPTGTMTTPSGTGTPGAVSGTAGTTGSVAGTGSAAGTTGAATGVPTGTSGVTAGTTGTMTGSTGATTPTTGVTGTAGVAGTTPTTGATGTASGGIPPAVGGAPGMPAATYQLSGTSVSPYVGQSVQVTGTLVPSANVAATAGAQSSGVARPTGGTDVVGATTNQQAIPQFQVTRVEPLGIRCPQ